jgi:ectoine hydroxylase-related dioxygenase (phytanoyl-CoA dioxygenase family)
MLLFKDKINYKLPFGNGFAAHLDAPAYDHIGQIEHLTANFSVDEATPENGCIEVVPGSHKMDVELSHGGAISQAWQDSHEWTQVPLHPGDVLLFGSHLAHRSGPNRTNNSRSMIYATYHGKNDGENLREGYYRHRRENFPPDNGKITYLVDLCNRVTDDECRACRGEGLLTGVQKVCFCSAFHVGEASGTREDPGASCSLD